MRNGKREIKRDTAAGSTFIVPERTKVEVYAGDDDANESRKPRKMLESCEDRGETRDERRERRDQSVLDDGVAGRAGDLCRFGAVVLKPYFLAERMGRGNGRASESGSDARKLWPGDGTGWNWKLSKD